MRSSSPSVATSRIARWIATTRPALMVTDTAYLRNPHYHSSLDTLETLDLGRMTRVVTGLGSVLRELDRAEPD